MAIEIYRNGASIAHLRKEAKARAKIENIPLHRALEVVAQEFAESQGWHIPDGEPPFSWENLQNDAWKLSDNGLLFCENPIISAKKAGRNGFVPRPWRLRLEIFTDSITGQGIHPLIEHNGQEITSLPHYGWYKLAYRLERFVDSEGVLVSRVKAGRRSACLDSGAERCSCCLRNDHMHWKERTMASYNRAIVTRSVSKMAEWAVGCFAPCAEALGPVEGEMGGVSTTREAHYRLKVMQDLDHGQFEWLLPTAEG
ncbi:hypothetical protein N6L27_21590 [Leisingera sp. SS27]|uniref:hypothetical protein n=1 Tax=Leisingera sp. SS27 TaxID=2979462 RepID=UPI00233042ED|nr:hypothetical protein [Leisingera sp. SS27]MDC0660606.1 hypothetical protein [Leisingera sp. SS27]